QGLLQFGALAFREGDEQHARRGELASRADAFGLLVERQFEPEGAAEADRALEANAAAHQFDELLRDGGAEPGAAEAPRGRLVCLSEALEDFRLGLGRYADAGVADRELEAHLVGTLALRRNVHRDVALLGELERVANQID